MWGELGSEMNVSVRIEEYQKQETGHVLFKSYLRSKESTFTVQSGWQL